MAKKIPEIWDECKTKEQKEAFKERLEKIDATEETISFDDWIFKEHMKELSKK